jgi:exodeoxyribonuclease-5
MITPTNEQSSVIRGILEWYRSGAAPFIYIAGYAGVGKTTTVRFILDELKVRALAATYTGKASAVLRSKGIKSQTIHSLIYAPLPGSSPVEFALNPESDLRDADLLVLDEVSMVDRQTAEDLLSFGKKIIVLGDPGQLPPIRGAGYFTSVSPDFFLSEIHRQAKESPILRAATAAREGRRLPLYRSEALSIVEFRGFDEIDPDAQALCGVHRVRWALTRHLRGADAPDLPGAERVICRRNQRSRALYNGLMGNAVGCEIIRDRVYLTVHMDDEEFTRCLVVDRTPFDEHRQQRVLDSPRYSRDVDLFDFGRVLTVHSAQGSEWPAVSLIDDSGMFRKDANRWLYTGITRAAEKLTIYRR